MVSPFIATSRSFQDRKGVLQPIALLSEDLTAVVFTWKLLRARPVKYSFGDLNAKGTDVAIEELVLAYERLEME
jgi:phage tail-like protein